MTTRTNAVVAMGWRRRHRRAAAATASRANAPSGSIADRGEREVLAVVEGADGDGNQRHAEHDHGEGAVGGAGPASERPAGEVGFARVEPAAPRRAAPGHRW